jgi:hypothetical protein
MGLPLRITFKDNDHVYQILNIKLINQHTIELELVLDGEKVVIEKDSKNRWIQKEGELFDPELIQALGRSVSRKNL